MYIRLQEQDTIRHDVAAKRGKSGDNVVRYGDTCKRRGTGQTVPPSLDICGRGNWAQGTAKTKIGSKMEK